MIEICIKKSKVNLTIETWGYSSSKLLKYNIYCLFLHSNSCYMCIILLSHKRHKALTLAL